MTGTLLPALAGATPQRCSRVSHPFPFLICSAQVVQEKVCDYWPVIDTKEEEEPTLNLLPQNWLSLCLTSRPLSINKSPPSM